MIKKVEEIILNQFAKKGLKLGRLTKKEDVVRLIKSLYPYQTQYELIRLGPFGDGGYLLPEDLDGLDACFSPGVSTISEFERECLQRGMKVFMADKSVDKPNWDIPESEYKFLKKYIGCTSNEEFITMDDWFQLSNLPENAELLLQMDIEGGEYISLANMSDSLLSRFRIMIVEFHHFDFIWHPYSFELVEAVFKKILQCHICVHIHPNNIAGVSSFLGIDIPRTIEVTFLRRDRAEVKSYQTQFPHKLDFDNSNDKHLPLPKNWYKSV